MNLINKIIYFFKSLSKPLYTQPRLVPSLFAVLVLGLLLFSSQELPEEIKKYLVPALIVYCLGTALLQTIHRLIAISHEDPDKAKDNERTIPKWILYIIYAAHILLLSCFIGYLFIKDIL